MSILKTLAGLRVDFIAGTLGIGGAECQSYYMAKVLSEAGARIRVLSLTSGEPYQKKISELGVPIIYVGSSPLKIIRLYNIICELKKEPPQIIHSLHFYTNLYAAIAARVVGAKDIGSIRCDLLDEIREIPFFGRLSLVYPKFIIANSQFAVKRALNLGRRPNSIFLLENAVDTELFQPAWNKKEYLRRPDSGICIINAGRLTIQKRIDIFLHILSGVHRLAPDVHGLIVGDGPLRKSLEDLSKKLRLIPETVEFTGIVEDMPSLYQRADLLVLTSDFEGMPNVVLEAMACGLPVVATDAGAVPDIVNHAVTGYVVPTGDINRLIQCLSDLIRSSTLRQEMGAQARAVAEERFSLRTLPKKLFSLYSLVLTQ